MKTPKTTRVLTPNCIQKIIEKESIDSIMDQLIHELTKTIYEFDTSKTKIPVRSGFNYTNPNPGLIEWMPVYQTGENVLLKLVGYHPKNPSAFNLPTIASSISSYNVQTGQLIGLMDGVLATALRTGAASAIASRYLAHPNSKVLGLIGCGAQSITQIHAITREFDIDEVLIYDVSQIAMQSFSSRIEPLNLNLKVTISSIDEIISYSDIICSATSIGIGEGPLFDGIKTKNHVHINAVGSDFPGKVEIPLSLLKEAFVCPDFLEQALQEGESQQLLKGHIGPELHQVIKYPTKYSDEKYSITVFDSTGWALEDRVIFQLFMTLANKHNIGEEIQIEYVPSDSLNPYEFLKMSNTIILDKIKL